MEQRIGIERMEEAINLFGSFDENIRLLESEFAVQVVNRGGEIVISGEPENVMLAEKAVQALLTPMVTVRSMIEWTYSFWPIVLGLTGRPFDVMQITSCVSSLMRSA